jgi:DNA invertase Pin-like site-specific DNA recombinase
VTRVIGYTRRSKANRRRPDDPALGIAAQRTAITAEADRRGWEVMWTEPDDGWSGRNVSRPGLQTALGALARGEAAGLVVAKLNRLSRSVADFAALLRLAQRQGWSVVALDLGIDTSTINGRLVANLVMAVAEWEREVIGERTAEGLAEKRAAGARLGREQMIPPAVARRIRRHAREGMSARAIARRLTAAGVPSPTGKARWSHSTVARFLARSAVRPKRTEAA